MAGVEFISELLSPELEEAASAYNEIAGRFEAKAIELGNMSRWGDCARYFTLAAHAGTYAKAYTDEIERRGFKDAC